MYLFVISMSTGKLWRTMAYQPERTLSCRPAWGFSFPGVILPPLVPTHRESARTPVIAPRCPEPYFLMICLIHFSFYGHKRRRSDSKVGRPRYYSLCMYLRPRLQRPDLPFLFVGTHDAVATSVSWPKPMSPLGLGRARQVVAPFSDSTDRLTPWMPPPRLSRPGGLVPNTQTR